MKKLIVIADWAGDSLTKQEFLSAANGFLKDSLNTHISFVSSTPSTIHTAFLMSQVISTEERCGDPMQTIVFQNTDPRIQTNESVDAAKGAEFIIIKLQSGIYVCGPNAGYDFSMIRNKIDEIFRYPGFDKGSQFRSRDLYARVCAHLMDEMEDELELEETTITHEDLKGKHEMGEMIEIKINGEKQRAKLVSNLFGGTPGELVIYPGSSGQKDNPYMEISVWRHFTEKNPATGIHAFNHPRPGQKIEFK